MNDKSKRSYRLRLFLQQQEVLDRLPSWALDRLDGFIDELISEAVQEARIDELERGDDA